MRKKVLSLTFLLSFFPLLVSAAFERDLYFGLRDNPEVTKLQEFLRDQGVYSGPVTGNFFSLTKEGVKRFQEREKISPAAGYFGQLTRAQVNQLVAGSTTSKEETIATLTKQIAELKKQLQELIVKQAAESSKPEEPAVPYATSSTSVVETPAKPVKLIVSGSATSTFPAIEMVAFKMGEFTLENNTSADILVSSFDTIVSEEMDSTDNRNREILFLIRDGPGISDTLLSTTKFTFILAAPKLGEPHKAVVKLPYDKVIKVRDKKTASVWIEKMKFVKSGTLKLYSTKTFITSEAEIEGSFNLVLTKEPPL